MSTVDQALLLWQGGGDVGRRSRARRARLRLRTVATKDRPCPDFPYKNGDEYDPAVLLDLDYWALLPR